MPAEAFLFDVGNVIITFDFGRAVRKLEPFCRVEVPEALARVSSLTPALERGEMSPMEFIAQASERIGYSGSPQFFQESFEDIFELNQPMVDFIEHRTGKAELHLLSNTNGIHVPFFEKTYPVFSQFRGRIYSHEVGVMKPDPGIYEAAIQSIGLDPGRTVYIDDLEPNCEAGRSAGFLTLRYSIDRHDEFLEEVHRYL